VNPIIEQVEDIVAFLKANKLDFRDLNSIIRALREQGLAMVVMGRGDAEGIWQEQMNTTADMPDAVWERIQNTWGWTDGWSAEPIMDDAWWLVTDAVSDAIRAGD
jgi:hypothetical protein